MLDKQPEMRCNEGRWKGSKVLWQLNTAAAGPLQRRVCNGKERIHSLAAREGR